MRAVDRRRARARSHRWLPLLAGAACAAPALAEVEFQPAVSIGVAHTDNLTLAADDTERETVYQLIPVFSLEQSSARMRTNVSYRAEAYYFDGRSDSDVFQIYNADFQVALDPDNFFLELGALRDQSIRDPEAPIATSNLLISTNRVDRDDYYAGPRFQYAFGENGTVGGGYRRTRTRYPDEDEQGLFVADFDSDEVWFAVDNYRRQRGLTWAARYTGEKTDFGIFEPWEYRQASVELGAWAGDRMRIFAAAGKESAWDQPFDPSLEDDFWEAGFARSAGESFSMELAAGERTFGSSRRATLNYSFGRGAMQLRYAEQPSTDGRDRYRDLATSDLLAGDLEDFLERPGSAERFLLKRLDWSLSFDLRRTRVALTVFDETREGRIRVDGTPLEDEAQSGGYLTASWALGPRTSLRMSAERVRREFALERDQDLRTVAIGADRRLGARTTLALTLSRMEEDSQLDEGGRAYEADLVSVLLTRTF